MGLVAAGVNGIKLGVGDELVSADIIDLTKQVVLITSDGKGKRCAATEFPIQGRYGQGVIGWKLKPGIRLTGMCLGMPDDKLVIHFLKSPSKLKKVAEFASGGRAATGKDVIEVKPGDQVLEMTEIQIPGTSLGEKSASKRRAKTENEKPASKNMAVEKTAAPKRRIVAEGKTKKASIKGKISRTKTTTKSVKGTGQKTKFTTKPEPKTKPAKEKTVQDTQPDETGHPDQLELKLD